MTKKITLSIYNQVKQFHSTEEFEQSLDAVVPLTFWDILDDFTEELEYEGSLLHVQRKILNTSAKIIYVTEDPDQFLEKIYTGSNLLEIFNLLNLSNWNYSIIVDDFKL